MTNAQDLSKPLGKIHRVNDDGSIPKDNPFVNTPNALPSIWTYGHRNPQGLAWDPAGLLWESEHGPTGGDEINVIEKGKNYGWGVISMGLQNGITERSREGMEQPIVYYTPTIAPSGIAFYTGSKYPAWKNNLFVAALAGQQLRRLEISGRKVIHQEAVFEQFGRVRAVTTGPDGLLYVLLQNPTGSGTGLGLAASTPGHGHSARAGRTEIADRFAGSLIYRHESHTDRSSLSSPSASSASRPRSPAQGTAKVPGNIWPPAKKPMEKADRVVSRGGDEDLLPAAGISRRARRLGADDRVADPDGLRCRRPAVGARDADLPAGHVRAGLARAAQPRQRAGRHERRRQDGQEDGVRRQAVDAARAEGARSRRARSASRRTCG